MKLVLDHTVWKEIAHLYYKLGQDTQEGGLSFDLARCTTKLEIHRDGIVDKIDISTGITKKTGEIAEKEEEERAR